MGINTSAGKHRFRYYTGANTIGDSTSVGSRTSRNTINEAIRYATTCNASNSATLTSSGQLISAPISTNINFNYVQLAGQYSSASVSILGGSTVCTTYVLNASVTTVIGITSTKWYLGEVLVSSSTSYTTDTPGTYTFQLTLDSGCIFTSILIVP